MKAKVRIKMKAGESTEPTYELFVQSAAMIGLPHAVWVCRREMEAGEEIGCQALGEDGYWGRWEKRGWRPDGRTPITSSLLGVPLTPPLYSGMTGTTAVPPAGGFVYTSPSFTIGSTGAS